MNKEAKINKYVEEWYGWMLDEVKRNIAKDMMREYADDLLHHVILDLYNLPEHKITQMIDDEKLRWYVLRGCGLQLRSSTSPFYRLHRRTKMESRDNWTHNTEDKSESFSGLGILDQVYQPYEHDELYDCFQMSMKGLGFYHRTLIEKHFIEKWSIQKIHKFYNISKTHIVKDINYALDYIREECNECDN